MCGIIKCTEVIQMTKEQMKQSADQHIASTKGVTKNKRKGYRENAWADVLALEKIMKANGRS